MNNIVKALNPGVDCSLYVDDFLIYQLRGIHNDPVLKLDGVEIPVVDQYKFLGVIFDRKLSFILHINYLKAKCHKALQLLRVVAHTDWGADKSTLLKLYKSLVRSFMLRLMRLH